tara:strand:- start:486 stop:602 length:117 start_codon:yes stop_codon:yes gene_type:complete
MNSKESYYQKLEKALKRNIKKRKEFKNKNKNKKFKQKK